LPPAPAQQPAEAIRAQSKLKAFANKLAEALTQDEAKQLINAAARKLWEAYADHLLNLANAIGEWLSVPNQQIANRLFDHLVGEQLDRVGHLEAKCPGRLQVYDNSNLVDCATGRSAGFTPLRI
jgi:hypothetical protein